jgi:FF domain
VKSVISVIKAWVFHHRSSYGDFAAKYGKDERFKGIDKTREREQIFNDYLSELRHKEKEESRTQREKVFLISLIVLLEGINTMKEYFLHGTGRLLMFIIRM